MKRLISLVLAILFVLPWFVGMGTLCFATTEDDPDYSFNSTYNYEVSREICPQRDAAVQTYVASTDKKTFTINLHKTDAQPIALENLYATEAYTGEGIINIAGVDESFYVMGELLKVQVDSDREGLIGNLTGETSTGTFLVITLHAIPEEQELFAYASVGFVTYNTDPEVLVFGNVFDGMSTLTESFSVYQSTIQMLSDGEYIDNTESELEIGQTSPLSTTAGTGDIQLRTYDSNGMTDSDGIYYDIATLSLYTPTRINPRENYEFGVKINANLTNAKNYAYSQYNMQAGGVWASSGMVEIISVNPAMNFLQLDPESSSLTATLNVPLDNLDHVGVFFEFFPVEVTMGILGIEAQLLKYNGSTRYNQARWGHYYSHNVDYGTDGAIESSNGYAGRAVGSWLVDQTSNVSARFTANGYITFTYNSASYVTGESFTGTFTVSVNNLNTYITVNPNS